MRRERIRQPWRHEMAFDGGASNAAESLAPAHELAEAAKRLVGLPIQKEPPEGGPAEATLRRGSSGREPRPASRRPAVGGEA